ncbi:MAG TPA: hypothetical protein VM013_00030 [Dehalococcoidia bacterium]|nr:hypothetical protein [Dehalococcoidia bacterium]
MKWSSLGVKLAGLAVGVLLVGVLGGTALAVYPPPTGSVSMGTSNTTPATGTSVSVSATVLNQFGSPAFGLSCTFQIASQPGSDAVVDAGPKMTDDYGIATTTLNTGTTPGSIVVDANCGELTSQVLVQVAGAPSATILLPATGTGSEAAPTSLVLIATLLATGLLCMAGGTSLRIAARRARGS